MRVRERSRASPVLPPSLYPRSAARRAKRHRAWLSREHRNEILRYVLRLRHTFRTIFVLMKQGRKAMKVTTLRFGEDLWRLLEAEAALAGVSVSQYIRESALARAAAAAGARNEDPLVLLGAAGAQLSTESPTAADLRHRAEATRREVEATRAETEQAIRRSHELARQREQLRRNPR